MRKKPADMVNIVEDLHRLLEGIERGCRNGRHPDTRTAKPTAKLLRALADERELWPDCQATQLSGGSETAALGSRSARGR